MALTPNLRMTLTPNLRMTLTPNLRMTLTPNLRMTLTPNLLVALSTGGEASRMMYQEVYFFAIDSCEETCYSRLILAKVLLATSF